MLDYSEVSCMSCPWGIVVESLGMEGTHEAIRGE
jgi:hypothetical protein